MGFLLGGCYTRGLIRGVVHVSRKGGLICRELISGEIRYHMISSQFQIIT